MEARCISVTSWFFCTVDCRRRPYACIHEAGSIHTDSRSEVTIRRRCSAEYAGGVHVAIIHRAALKDTAVAHPTIQTPSTTYCCQITRLECRRRSSYQHKLGSRLQCNTIFNAVIHGYAVQSCAMQPKVLPHVDALMISMPCSAECRHTMLPILV